MIRLAALLAVLACPAFTHAAHAQANVGFGGTPYDAGQEVEVTADSLQLDQQAGTATFSGDVVIVQGDLRMAAGVVEVAYAATAAGGQDITRVVATGGVTVVRGADAAEGARADYDVAAGTLVLSGDVLVTQGPAAIAGDRLTIDLETGSGTVTGRVRTVLQPGGQ